MSKNISLDTKIELPLGYPDFLLNEVKRLRKDNAILEAKTQVMEGFFSLINMAKGPQNIGYENDNLYMVERDIEAAIKKATSDKPA